MSMSPGVLNASLSIFNQQKLDQPQFSGTPEFYTICSTPRSGSNVLCELLRKAGIGVPHEYFHRNTHLPVLASRLGLHKLGDSLDQFDLQAYIDQIIKIRTSSSGHFGFKAHADHFHWLSQGCDIEQSFPNLKYVFIHREDLIAQAVSFTKAGQTKQWTSDQIPRKTPVYKHEQIETRLQILNESNQAWLSFFKAKNIDYHEIVYEELIANTKSVCDDLALFLNADAKSDFALDKLQSKPQSNRINLEWIEKFKSGQKTAW